MPKIKKPVADELADRLTAILDPLLMLPRKEAIKKLGAFHKAINRLHREKRPRNLTV